MKQQLDAAARKIAESIEATAERWASEKCLQLCESLKVIQSLDGYRLPDLNYQAGPYLRVVAEKMAEKIVAERDIQGSPEQQQSTQVSPSSSGNNFDSDLPASGPRTSEAPIQNLPQSIVFSRHQSPQSSQSLPVSDEKVSSAPQAAPVDKNSSPEHFGYLNGALNRSGPHMSFREKLALLAAVAKGKVAHCSPGTLLHSRQLGRAEAFADVSDLLDGRDGQ